MKEGLALAKDGALSGATKYKNNIKNITGQVVQAGSQYTNKQVKRGKETNINSDNQNNTNDIKVRDPDVLTTGNNLEQPRKKYSIQEATIDNDNSVNKFRSIGSDDTPKEHNKKNILGLEANSIIPKKTPKTRSFPGKKINQIQIEVAPTKPEEAPIPANPPKIEEFDLLNDQYVHPYAQTQNLTSTTETRPSQNILDLDQFEFDDQDAALAKNTADSDTSKTPELIEIHNTLIDDSIEHNKQKANVESEICQGIVDQKVFMNSLPADRTPVTQENQIITQSPPRRELKVSKYALLTTDIDLNIPEETNKKQNIETSIKPNEVKVSGNIIPVKDISNNPIVINPNIKVNPKAYIGIATIVRRKPPGGVQYRDGNVDKRKFENESEEEEEEKDFTEEKKKRYLEKLNMQKNH